MQHTRVIEQEEKDGIIKALIGIDFVELLDIQAGNIISPKVGEAYFDMNTLDIVIQFRKCQKHFERAIVKNHLLN